jgi:hypothetical protein
VGTPEQPTRDDLEGANAHKYEQDPETVPDQPVQEGDEDDQLPIHTD